MSLNVTPLTHYDAVKQTDHCYVINNSNGQNKRPRGILFMSVKDGDREVAIELPATWIPIDLYGYASPEAIRQSVDFRTLMRENHIVAIASNEAKEILGTSAAREEKGRISLRSDTKSDDNVNTGKISINTGGSSVITESSVATASSPVNEQLVTLINGFNNNEIMDERASQNLRQMVNAGQVSLQQLQSSAMKISNTGSTFYSTLEELISELASGTRNPAGGAGSNTQPSF